MEIQIQLFAKLTVQIQLYMEIIQLKNASPHVQQALNKILQKHV